MDNSERKDEIIERLSTVLDAPPIEWSIEHEKILIEWADKAMCYRWLHAKANAKYNSLNTWYTIPVIAISTFTGTANFAQSRIPIEYQGLFTMVVGGFNILAGIITTIQQFLKITQLNEAHRVSSISWDKFYRNIKIELAKHPKERLPVAQMLKISKEEFDRLMEISPSIPEQIVLEFKKSFKQSKTFEVISKPEICDVLISTEEFRNPWYDERRKEKEKMEIEVAETNKNRKENQNKLVYKQIKIIDTFMKEFYKINNREPMYNEIVDNLQDSMAENEIKCVLDEYIGTIKIDINN